MIDRRRVLGGVAGLAVAAAAPARYVYEPRATPIAADTWVVRGADEAFDKANGGAIANLAFIDTAAGAVVIDAGPSARYGAELRRLVETTTGKRVARVYLTHFHPDHILGAGAFDPATVAAPPAMADLIRAEAPGFTDGLYRLLGDWMRGTEVAIPQQRLTTGHETFGAHRLRLLPTEGHSAADLAILDETTGVLFASDLVFLDRAPATPHADLTRWRRALGELAALGAKLTVPGHGRVHGGTAGIDQTRAWLDWLEDALVDAAARGLDMTEAMALPIPAHFSQLALARYELERSVVHLYPAIEARLLPRVDRDS